MATRIVIPMMGINGEDGSVSHLVEETFESVLESFFPLSQPGSSLELRAAHTFTLTTGDPIFIPPGIAIGWIEANVDPDG